MIQSIDVNSISFSDTIGGKMTISCEQTRLAIERAAEAIKSDQLVAFPTETVYGLAASAISSNAVSKIFKTKGRPSDNPLIVHVSSIEMIEKFITSRTSSNSSWEFPLIYKILIQSFWPGPLTILIPTSTETCSNSKICPISDSVTCGLSTVAVRMPSHPISRALLTETGLPLAAPSANISGRPSPTTAQHVEADFQNQVPIILDGGSCSVGVESTVVDGLNSDGRLRILRLGGLSIESIQSCLTRAGLVDQIDGKPVIEPAYQLNQSADFKPTTPGMKYKHYSPRVRVILLQPILLDQNLTPRQNQTIPNIHEFVSQLNLNSYQFNPSSLDSHELDQTFKIGLMMIEGSSLAQEFEIYSSNLNPTTTIGTNQVETRVKEKNQEDMKIQFIKSNLGQINQPEVSAKKLYGSLRYLDESKGVNVILVECLPEVGLGKTVMERLKKASGLASPSSILISSPSLRSL